MLTAKTILLAYHGTDGAKRAEALAYQVVAHEGAHIVHLLVVPELSAGMQGDDWLNNASTRDTFGDYVEEQLAKDAAEQLAAVEANCKQQGFSYTSILRVGDPADCVLAAARQTKADLVVIGPPRSKKISGLRSRMDLEKLVRDLPVPLLVANGE